MMFSAGCMMSWIRRKAIDCVSDDPSSCERWGMRTRHAAMPPLLFWLQLIHTIHPHLPESRRWHGWSDKWVSKHIVWGSAEDWHVLFVNYITEISHINVPLNLACFHEFAHSLFFTHLKRPSASHRVWTTIQINYIELTCFRVQRKDVLRQQSEGAEGDGPAHQPDLQVPFSVFDASSFLFLQLTIIILMS